jgi:predicted TIM-barrel fold metal-dependent hydrolase
MLIEYMDWAGIDGAVLYQAPMYGNHNEFTAEAREAYPDKFASVGLADPREQGRGIGELQCVKELGHVGVKLEIPDQPPSERSSLKRSLRSPSAALISCL